jgi:flavin-dependent dehydrogenase
VPSPSYDVAIVGGGPAGCAAGLSLWKCAPVLSVVVVEASGYEGLHVGETLPPPARQLLEHLDLWDAFRTDGHREVHGTAAVWGAAVPYETDYLCTAQGVGWHLDRAAFDARLAKEAERKGIRLLRRTRLTGAEPTGETWRLHFSDAGELRARFVIDATGSAAAFARRRGVRFLASDRLAGFARLFEDTGGGDPRTLVEAFADGWWYTAGLPGGLRTVVCMTDSDLARRLRLLEPTQWSRLLQATTLVAETVRGARAQGPLVIKAVQSRRLQPAAGPNWLAVGDAASCFDPLSSQGIMKALRCGIFASYAVGDLLVNGDHGGLERYRRFVAGEFERYLRVRAHYYAAEPRWPEREFWRRRQAPRVNTG